MTITIEDFKKLEIRAGQLALAEKVEGSDKLVRLEVDFGEFGKKQIIAGIAKHFSDPAVLVGKKFAFAYNLEPRMLKGLESQGMILAAQSEGSLSLLSIDGTISSGSIVS